jgi:hypothetical protein
VIHNGLWHGQRVRVQCSASDQFPTTGKVYSVTVDRRNVVGEFPEARWANAFAEVIESFIPAGASFETASNYVANGILMLPSLRWLVASVLERAAERYEARSLEELQEPTRKVLDELAITLRNEVRVLQDR